MAAAVQRHGWDILPAMLVGRLDPDRFDAMIRLVQHFAEQGFAYLSGLRIAGLSPISTAVHGPMGGTVAALTVSGVDERFSNGTRSEWTGALRETAAELERQFSVRTVDNKPSR